MLKVIAEDFIKIEAIEIVLPLYHELVQTTKKELQCIAYDLYIDQTDAGHFIFIEEWVDRAALNAHCETKHFKRLVPMIDKYKRKQATYILMDSFYSNQKF